jgi:hypothetical protein
MKWTPQPTIKRLVFLVVMIVVAALPGIFPKNIVDAVVVFWSQIGL